MSEQNKKDNADPSSEGSMASVDNESFSSLDFPLPSATPFHEAALRPISATVETGTVLRKIEELTLAQLLTAILRDPFTMLPIVWEFMSPDSAITARQIAVSAEDSTSEEATSGKGKLHKVRLILKNPELVGSILQAFAFVVALAGCIMLGLGGSDARRSEETELMSGLPYLGLAMGLWFAGEEVIYLKKVRSWFSNRTVTSRIFLVVRLLLILLCIAGVYVAWDGTNAPPEEVVAIIAPGFKLMLVAVGGWLLLDLLRKILEMVIYYRPHILPARVQTIVQSEFDRTLVHHSVTYRNPIPWYMRVSPARLIYGVIGSLLCVITWYGTSGNTIGTITFYIWLLSVGFWALCLAPLDWDFVELAIQWRRRILNFEWRKYSMVIIAFVLIMGIAVHFRFHDLRDHPREMTDDHVEKILDAARVRDGLRPIFFANNGGREPFQMYTIALVSHLPGLGINHFTLKVVAAVESLLTIPVVFWMAYEVLSGEKQRMRLLVALLTAGLVAGSYWHVAITRQALRIALTPLVSSLLLIYLSRALRRNTRGDFIISGIVLGFGLYTYQAVRMWPVVIVLAIAMVIYFVAKNWRERARYFLNSLVLVWISFVVFVPMFHYSVEYPDLFWRRTAGRLFGDDVLEETLEDGTIVLRNATLEEKWDAFENNIPILLKNFRNVLLMFNWKGDVAAISGVPNNPAMDPISGALLVIGISAWFALMLRRRDVVYWLIPCFILLMLLPSALSIAFPVENPSHTRTSGAIPGIYLVTSLPLAILVDKLLMVPGKRFARIGAVVVCIVVVPLSFFANSSLYFGVYPKVYSDSFDPYSEPGDYLRGFVLSGGSYGNAFMVGYPHWWSHRAIGLASGLETMWPNGVVDRSDIPGMLRDHQSLQPLFRFDPNRDILFFYSPNDLETGTYLAELFPDGYEKKEITYALNNDYMTYRVPAIGAEKFEQWLQMHGVN